MSTAWNSSTTGHDRHQLPARDSPVATRDLAWLEQAARRSGSGLITKVAYPGYGGTVPLGHGPLWSS